MGKYVRIEVILVPLDEIEQSLPGFLDMLCYDAARLVEFTHQYVILRKEGWFTPARWHSFGIHPLGPEWTTPSVEHQTIQRLIGQYTAARPEVH